MTKYLYYAKNLSGDEIKGEMEARDHFELAQILRQKKYTLISSQKKKGAKMMSFSLPGIGTISMNDKIMFSRNLSVMISAGVSITRGLDILQKQTQNKKFKKIIKSIGENIQKGGSLSESMKENPGLFSPLFVAMTKVGEESGNLSESLQIISDQLERDNSLKKKIKGAMVYPLIILIAMVVIGILMLIYVVPTLVSTFAELGVELPISTQIVIALSNFLSQHTLLFLGLVISFIFATMWFLRTKIGKKAISALLLKLPVFSPLVKKINSARTSRTLSSLISSGVNILDALSITQDVLQNYRYKQVLEQAKKDIQKGDPLSESFKKATDLYPILVGEVMAVGEETGKLSSMLKRLAGFYEEDVADTTKNMSTIIEPILMVLIGVFVGFFAISMIKPMYSLMSGI